MTLYNLNCGRVFRVFSYDAKQEFRLRRELMACNLNCFLRRHFEGVLMHLFLMQMIDSRFSWPFRIFQNYPALKFKFRNVELSMKKVFLVWQGSPYLYKSPAVIISVKICL